MMKLSDSWNINEILDESVGNHASCGSCESTFYYQVIETFADLKIIITDAAHDVLRIFLIAVVRYFLS